MGLECSWIFGTEYVQFISYAETFGIAIIISAVAKIGLHDMNDIQADRLEAACIRGFLQPLLGGLSTPVCGFHSIFFLLHRSSALRSIVKLLLPKNWTGQAQHRHSI